jgi:hypothetical protein
MPLERTYNCTQQQLYTICVLGWNACSDNLAAFTAFSPLYDAPYITAKLAEVTAAEASKTLRVELSNKATECCDLWQKLKRYIIKAYPKDQQQIKLDAAGQQHYSKAANEDWEAAKRLILDGEAFALANTAALTANSNMPPAFPATLTTAKGEYDTLFNDFFTAGQTDEIETQTKITANNNIHAALMSMFLDGQEIFKANEAVKKLFTFDQVLLTVAGPGIAGIRGLITDSATGLKLPNGVFATISIFGTEHTTQSNGDSRYEISPVAAGTYTIVIECPGYQTLQIPNIEIQTGTLKTLNITLTPTP